MFAMVGILNTAIHWALFVLLYYRFDVAQSHANLAAFACAVTFSFFANAKVTFQSPISLSRYIAYVGFLGLIAYSIGLIADLNSARAIYTLGSFSIISFCIGFLYSRYFIFKMEA